MMNKVNKVFPGLLFIVLLSYGWWHFSRVSTLEGEESEKAFKVIVPKPEQEEAPVEIQDIPDFASILDVQKKKDTFFAFIKKLVDMENKDLAKTRSWLRSIQDKPELNSEEESRLLELVNRYRVDEQMATNEQLFDELLLKVDEIPVSLALVQAANESAWGTSRFALDGNNYFGQWCFSAGCGLVPERRPEGARYEVRKFESPLHSVRSYMHNLNSSHHYESMREMRMKRREMGEPVTGAILAQGLYAYSIRGVEYVDELVKMIEGNDLLRYDLEKKSD